MSPNTSSRQRPFGVIPDPRFYFPHRSIQAALDTTVRAMTRWEGPVAVLGGSGYGKSLLAELVCDSLCDRFDCIKLQSARICSRQALLQNILYELQLPYRGFSEGELRLSILDRLEPSPETAPEGILIVVDEAHTLHAKLLDELRLLTNFARNNQPRVRLVLLGNMRLEETLTSPILESLNQRLAARCYLQPMNREETFEYIRHQLRLAGSNSESCITADALGAVYSASDGIPRLVNQLMDHALLLAAQQGHEVVTSDLVNESWAEMQQFPSPWTTAKSEFADASRDASGGHLVEYGALDDSDFREGSTNNSLNFFAAFSDTANASEPALEQKVSEEYQPQSSEIEVEPDSQLQIPKTDFQTYDTLGLWENDPPLRSEDQIKLEPQPSSRSGGSADYENDEIAEQLFGTGFDLEIDVPSQGSAQLASTKSDIEPASRKIQTQSEDQDYLVRLQKAADTLGQVQQFDIDNVSEVKGDSNSRPDYCDPISKDPRWSINVCASADGGITETSIEDIVSLLNFSAFMIEPFSVQQIPLQAGKNVGSSAEALEASQTTPEGIRVNDQKDVVMLHRPLETSQFFNASDDYDDDRDLLIIEEQVGVNGQMLLQNLPSEPAQKPAPYNQLFSRLRR